MSLTLMPPTIATLADVDQIALRAPGDAMGHVVYEVRAGDHVVATFAFASGVIHDAAEAAVGDYLFAALRCAAREHRTTEETEAAERARAAADPSHADWRAAGGDAPGRRGPLALVRTAVPAAPPAPPTRRARRAPGPA